MDDTQFAEIIAQHESLEPKIWAIVQHNTKMDLLKMARSCSNLRDDISRELVECRRLHRLTVKYHELLERYQTSVNSLQEYTTFALLLDH